MPMQQPVPEPPPHFGPRQDDLRLRDQFGAEELALVLSRYDLGVIEQIESFPKGSRRSPKVRIQSRKGDYLLKRRAPGRDDPYRVAFCHELQLFLAEKLYPVAGLIGTRDRNNSMVQLNGHICEMFNFITGSHYDNSVRAAERSGAALGRLHSLLAQHSPKYEAPIGSYHDAAEIDAKIARIPAAILAVDDSAEQSELESLCTLLRNAYHDAASRANDCGLADAAPGIVHGDWHPGNIVYRDGRVVAVLDFDSARLEPRASDIANAALQFSIKMDRPDEPLAWPDGFSTTRIRALLKGYAESGGRVSDLEIDALPWLMVEALIVESVAPIAAAGTFGRISGMEFLTMVQRKVEWIQPRAAKLAQLLRDQP